MKKTVGSIILLTLLIVLLFSFVSCESDKDNSLSPMTSRSESSSMMHIIDPDSEVRGVWIASVYNINYPSYPDLSESALRSELDSIISTCVETGMNTIYFQVRPSCDALYKSDIFPVSKWISSTGYLSFDPLEYMVRNCHYNNIRLYAWVNPLRISVDTADVNSLPSGSPAREHPEWVTEYCGRLYFDPGIPEVRTLVTDGVREIVRGYDVDGVVFDDYFYPYPAKGSDGKIAEFNDSATYKQYGKEFDNLGDWRRNNINELVLSCYNAVHGTDPECLFGISPFGVWQNNNGKNGGSDTKNLESYNDLYCDTLAWAKGGYVDFISPQIYWRFDSSTSPYDTVVRWWNRVLDGTGVKLIVSHAAYQYEDSWTNPENEMNEQISYSRSEKTYYGSMMYGYSAIRSDVHGIKNELKSVFKDELVYTNIISNGLDVGVTSPENGSVTNEKSTYLIGYSDPYYPLYCNGESVSCTKSGYFNLFVELQSGENVFVFEQNGKKYEYKITYQRNSLKADVTDAVTGIYMDLPGIEGVYPSADVLTSGDTLWVQCTAPYKSLVTVSLAGETTELVPFTDPGKGGSGVLCVKYGKTIELPAAEDGKVTDLGNLTFSMSYGDANVSEDGGNVRIAGKGSVTAIRAIHDYSFLKISKNSSYYDDYTVQSAGMTDYADSLSDGFYHLRMGGYISADEVEEITENLPSVSPSVSSVNVKVNKKTTDVIFECKDNPPYNAYVDGSEFVLSLYNTADSVGEIVDISKNPIFSAISKNTTDKKTEYRLQLHDKYNFYGFDLKYTDSEIILSFNNPIKLSSLNELPLTGITIVLDAGHGGDETGARGFIGHLNEKDVNLLIVLSAAKKLQDLGANVILTRDKDETVTLYERMDFLEETEPDLCISIHQNSDVFTKDITKVRGTLGLYCMDSGLLLADTVGKEIANSLGRWYQGTRYQMLAMCRNPKFPSALIEVGYITSAEEFEEIVSERGISTASDAVVSGIFRYFDKQSAYLETYYK